MLLTCTSAWPVSSVTSSSGIQSAVTHVATVEIVSEAKEDTWAEEDNWDNGWDEGETIADPLEPLNRFFFHFNDKLYYWFLKPVARGYSAITAEDVRIAIRNFFDNLETPKRAVNSLLQGQVKDSSVEVARFVINSTVGFLGFVDFARDSFDLRSTREDTGQTFGYYGAGGGFYINWPILGPSNLRDSIGLIGDAYLHPFQYLDVDDEIIVGARVLDRVNQTALTLGDYELFTETALDPYAAVKDAYQQYRNGLIKE
ncbi:VacJ family lipoprotein [Thermodesulfobacteriota bacterium]